MTFDELVCTYVPSTIERQKLRKQSVGRNGRINCGESIMIRVPRAIEYAKELDIVIQCLGLKLAAGDGGPKQFEILMM